MMTAAAFLIFSLLAAGGRIEGTITAGPQAAAIADARVSLRARGDVAIDATRSDVDGRFTFGHVPIDTPYTLIIEARGLRPFMRTDVRLRAGEITRIDIHLELLNHQNLLKVNNIYGEGPTPLATFLAPMAGITNVDPARQIQFAIRASF
jgi:hypothetical protein